MRACCPHVLQQLLLREILMFPCIVPQAFDEFVERYIAAAGKAVAVHRSLRLAFRQFDADGALTFQISHSTLISQHRSHQVLPLAFG